MPEEAKIKAAEKKKRTRGTRRARGEPLLVCPAEVSYYPPLVDLGVKPGEGSWAQSKSILRGLTQPSMNFLVSP